MSSADEQGIFELEEDEVRHRRLIDDEVMSNISFAIKAAIISLHGLFEADDRPLINTPKQFVWFLLAKSTQNLRFACHGIEMGYYSSTYSILRSAYESLAYAVLFYQKEREVRRWLKNEFSKNPNPRTRSNQTNRAKVALQAKEHWSIKEDADRWWKSANTQIHATLSGIAREFNIDLDLLIPDDLEGAFVQSGEDLQQALDIYLESESLQSVNEILTYSEPPEDAVWIEIGCRYDQATAGSLAEFALHIGHRILDRVDEFFQVSNPKFREMIADWRQITESK